VSGAQARADEGRVVGWRYWQVDAQLFAVQVTHASNAEAIASSPAHADLHDVESPGRTLASGLPARQSRKHETALSHSFSEPVKHAVDSLQQ